MIYSVIIYSLLWFFYSFNFELYNTNNIINNINSLLFIIKNDNDIRREWKQHKEES